MADITINSGTPEKVALELMVRYMTIPEDNDAKLALYRECLYTVSRPLSLEDQPKPKAA